MPAEFVPLLEKNYAKYWCGNDADYREAMKGPFKNPIFIFLSRNT